MNEYGKRTKTTTEYEMKQQQHLKKKTKNSTKQE